MRKRSDRKGPRAVAITSQLPENIRFSVIPKRNSGEEAQRPKRTEHRRAATRLSNSTAENTILQVSGSVWVSFAVDISNDAWK